MIRIGTEPAYRLRKREAHDLLVQLGEFARDDDLALRAQHRCDIRQALGDPMRRFVEDERNRLGAQALERSPARGRAGRKEATEMETAFPEAGRAQGGDRGTRTRNRHDPESCVAYPRHGTSTGVGYRRRSRIGDQRNVPSVLHESDELPCGGLLVVLVQGQQTGSDTVGVEQASAVTRILGGNHVNRAQHLKRAKRYVGKISERRCDHI